MGFTKNLKKTFGERTVLITGHTGFKGGWLSVWLESLGARVVGYSLDPPTDPSFYIETGVAGRIEDIRGDVLDREKISGVVQEYAPDFIFHLAAQPLVRTSYTLPYDTFNVNIMGTVNILESVRLSERPVVCVCITSDKCYKNNNWAYAYRENDPLGGHDPYSGSKGAAEIVIASYRDSFFTRDTNKMVSLSSARAGNIIGGGDFATDRLVPDCMRALSNGQTIKIRNPTAIRPWQFVLDPLSGYLSLAMKMKENPKLFADAWNFGPYYPNSISVEKIVESVVREWGTGRYENVSDPDAVHEARYLMLDIAKSVTGLGWKPLYTIDETIRKTVTWYKGFFEKDVDMYQFSLGQIDTFMKDVDSKFLY